MNTTDEPSPQRRIRILSNDPAPQRVAAALRMALDDAVKVRAQLSEGGGLRYHPHSGQWHQGCRVCLAGMIIARRFVAFDDTEKVWMENFEPRWQRVFQAIDMVRGAQWGAAAEKLWPQRTKDQCQRPEGPAATTVFEHKVRGALGDQPYGDRCTFDGWTQFEAFALTLRRYVLPAIEAAEAQVLGPA